MNMICAQGAPNSLIRHIQENPAYGVQLIDLLNRIAKADPGANRLTYTYALVPHALLEEVRKALQAPEVAAYLNAADAASQQHAQGAVCP